MCGICGIASLEGAHGDAVHRATGLFLSPHYGASKLRWALDNLPAVREARDALLVIAVATPPLLVIAVLFGVASSQLEEFLRWVGGTLLMAVVLLVCLASALLAADRVARHWWNLRPYPLRCIQLIPASLGVGLLLVAGYPTTEPVIVGLVLVAVLMGALVVAAAALDL